MFLIALFAQSAARLSPKPVRWAQVLEHCILTLQFLSVAVCGITSEVAPFCLALTVSFQHANTNRPQDATG